jgi:hypothetical protein
VLLHASAREKSGARFARESEVVGVECGGIP